MLKYLIKNIILELYNIVYALFFKPVQYFAIKKVKRLMKKSIINHCLVKITSIINKLLTAVEKKHNM